MRRSLIHFWKVNLAVLLGAAVASAVLTGALLVGDSVKGSLRDLALDRLGRIEEALLSERFFREGLGDAAGETAAPVILLRGTATLDGSGARASGVSVFGVDGRFAALYRDFPEALDLSRREGQIFASVVLNRSLQVELDAAVGDGVLLSFPMGDDVPRDTLLGRRDREHVLGTFRGVVVGVIPDAGPGRFGLAAQQGLPFNAFVDLGALQRSLDQRGRVNAVLAATTIAPEHLRERLHLDDLGLFLVQAPSYVAVQSREFVLRPSAEAAVAEAVRDLSPAGGADELPFQTYLANAIRLGDRMVPYSMVTAVELPVPAPFESLLLQDGSPAPSLAEDEILLNSWTARDLGAKVGDEVRLQYYVVQDTEAMREESARFRVRGIVRMEGMGADPDLTPSYPGIGDAADMSAWDPPFPVELDRIRPRDERYWDDHRGTPKAFLSAATGRRLWSNRFGTVTAIQVVPPDGMDVPQAAARLESSILGTADPARFGYRVIPLRAESLDASTGATDFSQLFLAFSMFLIVSAALLVALLFRLGVEQRAREVGVLLAVGFPLRSVRRRFLTEGLLIGALGALLGVAGGVGYAALMMLGLRTLWKPAVGTSLLFLHVRPVSLATGWLVALVVVALSIQGTIRRLGKLSTTGLLAGSMRPSHRRRAAGWVAKGMAIGGLVLGLGLVATAATTGGASSAGLFFGAGSLFLVSGLAFFALWCRRARHRRPVRPGRGVLAALAARNSALSPGRSQLSAAMVACACFVIVAAAANRHDYVEKPTDRSSGAGGYTLMARSDIPLYHSLATRDGRFELGLTGDDALLGRVEVTPFRLLPGDDASCLNLYRPKRPRILGVPEQQIERGGFTFSATADGGANPWDLLHREMEPGVLPAFGDANSVQWILHLGLGKDLVLEDEAGEEIRLRLVGLFQKSIFQSDLLIAEEAFLAHFPSRGGSRVFLIDTGEADPRAVSEALESGLAAFGFDVTPTAELLAAFEQVQNTYISTFVALGGLGLLLGTLGLGVIMVRNVLERRGELATLRAFGFRKPRLARMVLAENAFLLLLGVGLGGGSALVAVAPHLFATGAAIPWASLGITLAAVLGVGLLSSVAAVRQVLRTPLLPALKAEN